MPRGPDRWRRQWGPGSGRRPPWWPDDEPFPPRGRPGPDAWRAMRRRFMWRAGLALLVFIAVVSVVIAFLVDLITSWMGGAPSFALSGVLYLLIILVVAFGLRRLFRGTAAPVGDLIEAAGRVEAGEFGVQVTERGPREVRSLAAAFNAMSQRLEATEDQRRRLLSDVSHELRTPLTVIQGTLEAILDGVYPADAAHLAPVLEETRILSRLVDDLRTLSSAESGNLSLHREPTDVAALLDEVAASFGPQAAAAEVALDVRAASDLPVPSLDPERIRQVVANLVVNALRHTPRGGRIVMEAGVADDMLTLSVTDTGTGMEPAVLERIFERFYRSPASRGSGLGLPIARELVRAHGGEISAESTPGRGTTLRVSLPHRAR